MTVVSGTVVEPKGDQIDKQSSLGRFQWTVLGSICLPCLIRKGDPYICVRIAESTVLRPYLRYFNVEVFTCILLPSFNITRNEEKLLNSINEDHCSYAFGKTAFSVDKDLLVKLEDLQLFYNFIEICFNKLNKSKSTRTDFLNKCGFIRINRDSIVPFVRKNNLQYVPLFYFEGEIDTLEPDATSIESWDLAYLKFCCKVHGISNEFFEKDQCQVVTVDCIKTYFPSDTMFEDYWPSQIINTLKTVNNQNGALAWIKKPPAAVLTQSSASANASQTPPTVVSIPTLTPLNQNRSNVSSVAKPVNYQPNSSVIQAAFSKPISNPVNAVQSHPGFRPPVYVPSNTVHYPPSGSNPSTLGQNSYVHPNATTYPVSAARSSTCASVTTSTVVSNPASANAPQPALNKTSVITSKKSSHRMDDILASNSNRIQNSIIGPTGKVVPPNVTLVSTNISTGNTTNNTVRSTDLNQNEIIDLSSPPSSPPSNRNLQAAPIYNFRPLHQILEQSVTKSATAPPYRTLTIGFNGKHIFTINMQAYDYTDKLVPLSDIINQYFQTTVEHLRNTLQNILEIQLYRGNSIQMQILKDHKKCRSVQEEIPLMLFKDLEQYYNSIEYVYNKAKNNAIGESKRQKFN